MSEKSQYDVAVVGAGPGGYVAAIRAAQLGLDTVCVERENLGGICLNWGCIPTKALLRSAEVLELCHRADEFGIKVENISFDFAAVIKRSRDISSRITKGVEFLFRKNKIDHIAGSARLGGAGRIDITLSEGGGNRSITAKHIIVATGARARELPGVPIDGERIIEYRKAMTLPERPTSMIVVGAGAIGVEFASFYRALGTEVTIVEFLPRLVPNEDEEISAELERAFKRRGIKFLTDHQVTGAETSDRGVAVTVGKRGADSEDTTIEADLVLVAIGVTGNVENIGLEDIGVTVERGFIKVNEHCETGAGGIYAIGDVIATPALAHVASAEGVYVAERIAGKNPPLVPYDAIPACTYCHPEIASVGLTEAQAREKGISVNVGKYPFRPMGKTMAAGEYPGMVKLLWASDNGALVGAHMIGPAVTDLIAEMTLAKTTEVNAESLIYTIHAHPTFAEAIKEASEDAYGHAIHL
ncbi:MAG: dihydrolipoyl dehydrogenase [Proteobacteria bacterium]|nr:dihydrolipoyl dehydrogenase [Pseudomonadota bacterium]